MNTKRISFFVGLIILLGVLGAWLIFRQNQLIHTQVRYQERLLDQQAEALGSGRRGPQVLLLSQLLDRIEEELEQSPRRKLQPRTIARIAGLNHSFMPALYFAVDSLSESRLSPERGQLLVTLVHLDIDTSSMNEILARVSFMGADLRGANLRGAYLQGIDLRGAGLQGADLSDARMAGADLRAANLWGARLNRADLSRVDARRATLAWAEMDSVGLREAQLANARLPAAKLRGADLRGSRMGFASLEGALLSGADLTGSGLYGSKLQGAQLQGAGLQGSNLRFSDLAGAILDSSDLGGSLVQEENWMDLLTEWEVGSADEIQQTYRQVVAFDTLGVTYYRLEKKGN